MKELSEVVFAIIVALLFWWCVIEYATSKLANKIGEKMVQVLEYYKVEPNNKEK